MKILAIETSCDETSVAIVYVSGSRREPKFCVFSHLVSSQINLHAAFGGVVPNLAKREHERLLVPLTLRALKEAGHRNEKRKVSAKGGSAFGGKNEKLPLKIGNKIKDIFNREPELLAQFEKKIFPLSVPDIDMIAVTNGPGLAPALWVGVNFAHALALVWKKSIVPVNHMKGHLFSALLQRGKNNDQYQISNIKFPLIALLVSGGHTELVLMKKMGSYKIIGEKLDDAAGEAFDKVARMMGLGYPGGPAIAVEAAKSQDINGKNIKIKLPRPMIRSNNYDFSFSGLKTAVLYLLRDMPKRKQRACVPAVAKEFQDAVVDVLVTKTIRAAGEYGVRTVAIGGGVSANHLLRKQLSKEIKKQLPNTQLFLPHPSLTGDNALMIAVAAVMDGKKKTPSEVGVEANMRLNA